MRENCTYGSVRGSRQAVHVTINEERNVETVYSTALSALWFKGGLGFDIDFNQNAYLRTQFLYGFRTATEFEKLLVEYSKGLFGHRDVTTNRGHGLDLKLGIGFRL